jgi:hypothetical protein
MKQVIGMDASFACMVRSPSKRLSFTPLHFSGLTPERLAALAFDIPAREADIPEQMIVKFGKLQALTPALDEPKHDGQSRSQVTKRFGDGSAAAPDDGVPHGSLLSCRVVALAVLQ